MQLYVSSNLNAKNINLNSTNQSIEGTNINRNAINPQKKELKTQLILEEAFRLIHLREQ